MASSSNNNNNNSNTIKASKSSFSIDNILEHKTQRSDPVGKRHQISSPMPVTAFAAAAAATPTSSATPSTAIYDLSASQQYALKNLEPVVTSAAAAATLLTPTTLRFNPAAIYSDPASLFYQQMLNLQKNSSLFMPHFQAAAVAAAAAAQPAAYCDQYSPFMDCEGNHINIYTIFQKLEQYKYGKVYSLNSLKIQNSLEQKMIKVSKDLKNYLENWRQNHFSYRALKRKIFSHT